MRQSRPIITLTTDFGHDGPFVAVMKAIIYQRCPQARVVDLTHEIEAQWPAEAGFWLAKSFGYFPKRSVHVAVVDPGVGTARAIIAAEYEGHIFIAPDNGLLAGVFGESSPNAYRLSDNWLKAQNWPPCSSTFHGRDIFAPLAAELAEGRITPQEIGDPIEAISPSPVEPAWRQNGAIHGVIISIDHFGNLISNVEGNDIADLRVPIVRTGGKTFALHRTYGSRKPGEFLALINSFGVIEISRVNSNASEALGLGRGTPIVISESAQGG